MGTAIRAMVLRTSGGAIAEARAFFASAPVEMPDVAILTDPEGRFTLYAPAPGRYELECHADGFNPSTATIRVEANVPSIDIMITMTEVE